MHARQTDTSSGCLGHDGPDGACRVIHNLRLEPGDCVLPCPFCGSADVELRNTHTASYWMACNECGAEHHGGKAFGRNIESSYLTLRHHQLAKVSALKAWNRRPNAAKKQS